MTVGSKLHMALTAAEGLRVQCEQFGLDTDDKQTKAQFFQLSQTIQQQVMPVLQSRVNQVEQEEPQYQVRQEAFKAAGQTQGAQAQQSQAQQSQAQQMGGISASTATTPSMQSTTSSTAKSGASNKK